MAEEYENEILEEEPVAGPSNPDPYYWVADEPKNTPSRYAGLPDGEMPRGLFTGIEDPGLDSWDILVPARQRWVCHRLEN
jgi:hypothetical protein